MLSVSLSLSLSLCLSLSLFLTSAMSLHFSFSFASLKRILQAFLKELFEAFLRVFRWQFLRVTLRDFLEEIVTVIHVKASSEDSLNSSFIELSNASVIVTGQGGRPITDIKHIECFFDWLGGLRCSRKALDHPHPPPFLPLKQT